MWWNTDVLKLLQIHAKTNLGSYFNPYNFWNKGWKYDIFDINDPYLPHYDPIKFHDQHFICVEVIVLQNMDQI